MGIATLVHHRHDHAVAASLGVNDGVRKSRCGATTCVIRDSRETVGRANDAKYRTTHFLEKLQPEARPLSLVPRHRVIEFFARLVMQEAGHLAYFARIASK